jgi:multiple sugar transport system substrate-binding protein
MRTRWSARHPERPSGFTAAATDRAAKAVRSSTLLRGVATATVSALALVACGGGSTDEASPGTGEEELPSDITAELTVSNWGDPNDSEVYAAAVERFKERFPNVTINDNFTPITTWSDYVNKLVADVAAGNAPDVINIAIEGLRLGADKNLFLPLDDFIASTPKDANPLTDMDQRLVDALAVDGSQLLVPNNWNNMLIYYNTRMFEEAGIERPDPDWTWDDFLSIAQQLTTGSGSDKVHGFAVPFFNFGLTPWWYTNGTSTVTEDLSDSNLDDPAMLEAVEFVHALVHEHQVAPSVEGTEPYQLFPAGKVAMTGAGHWVVGSFEELGFEDYDVLPWPQNTETSTVFGTAGFGIHPETDNPHLAWEYIKELASVETGQGFVDIGASIPARLSLAETEEFLAKPEHATLFYESLDYAKPVAAPANFNEYEGIFMRHMAEIMSGAVDSEAGLAAAHDELQTSFAN